MCMGPQLQGRVEDLRVTVSVASPADLTAISTTRVDLAFFPQTDAANCDESGVSSTAERHVPVNAGPLAAKAEGPRIKTASTAPTLRITCSCITSQCEPRITGVARRGTKTIEIGARQLDPITGRRVAPTPLGRAR